MYLYSHEFQDRAVVFHSFKSIVEEDIIHFLECHFQHQQNGDHLHNNRLRSHHLIPQYSQIRRTLYSDMRTTVIAKIPMINAIVLTFSEGRLVSLT